MSHTAEPEALVVTHWFDPGRDGEPYSATIRLTGRRVVRGAPRPGDTFVHEEQVERIVPGCGPVSVSAWTYGLRPGEWNVDARLIGRPTQDHGTRAKAGNGRTAEPLSSAAWSWRRWTLTAVPTGMVRTRWALLAPLARIPGVLPGSFTALAAAAILIALVVQSILAARAGLTVRGSLSVSLLAVGSGLIGAKLWSLMLHPGEAIVGPGWAVDGFLVVAVPVAGGALFALDLPIGPFLDRATPGLFFAVAIGRLGCFLTGCCAGRLTRHRLGIWSSDRRVGARRIPTQLLESAAGLVIGLVTLLVVLRGPTVLPGATFGAATVAYLFIRQFLLRLRAEPRQFLWRRSSRVPRPA